GSAGPGVWGPLAAPTLGGGGATAAVPCGRVNAHTPAPPPTTQAMAMAIMGAVRGLGAEAVVATRPGPVVAAVGVPSEGSVREGTAGVWASGCTVPASAMACC